MAIPDISAIVRNPTEWANGGIALASLDEWYKAAFYNGDTQSYYTYAGSNTIPVSGVDANFVGGGNRTVEVGSFDHFTSFYGTLDQNGNLWEMTDTVNFTGELYRRGGSYNAAGTTLQSGGSAVITLDGEGSNLGFRVVSLQPIPEPSTYAAIFGALALAFAAYRRRTLLA